MPKWAAMMVAHCIARSIMEYFEGNDLFSNFQHGFRHMRSCETQLLQSIDDLVRGVCDGNQFDRAIMDFSRHLTESPTSTY